MTKFVRVVLSGGGANLKNLPQFLSEKLEAPVELANPFSGLKISEEIYSQRGEFLQAPSGFALACGLAARDVDKEGFRPNLVPKKVAKGSRFFFFERVFQKTLQKKGMRIGLCIACAFLVIVGFQLGKVELYKRRVNSARRQVQLVKADLRRLQSQQFKLAEKQAEFQDRKSKLEARLNLLKVSRRHPEEFSRVLAEVATLIPEEIWLKKLIYSEQKLTITGSTFDIQLVAELIKKLEASPDFFNPVFNYTQKEPKKEGTYDFEITVEVKP